MRSGTPMQRLRERARISPSPERISYFRERGLEVAVEQVEVVAEGASADAADALTAAGDASDDAADALLAVDGLADGTTPFTGLNVGGVDVKPFLDKTDGSALTDSTGLDGGVVGTTEIAVEAVTRPARYDSAGLISMVSFGPMTTRYTVFTVSFTATGAPLEVDAAFYLRARHDQDNYDLYLVVERAAGDVFSSTIQALAMNGDGYVTGWQSISFSDTPPAGVISYSVRVYHSFLIGSPGSFDEYSHRNRTMSIREFKR